MYERDALCGWEMSTQTEQVQGELSLIFICTNKVKTLGQIDHYTRLILEIIFLYFCMQITV